MGIYSGTREDDQDDGLGLGSKHDEMLVQRENKEGQRSFNEDHPNAGLPPCGHKPTFKMSVGTSGCWSCHWMYDSRTGEWFQ